MMRTVARRKLTFLNQIKKYILGLHGMGRVADLLDWLLSINGIGIYNYIISKKLYLWLLTRIINIVANATVINKVNKYIIASCRKVIM